MREGKELFEDMNAMGDVLRDPPRNTSTLARIQQWIEQSQSETTSQVNDSEITDLRISGKEPGLNHPPPLVPVISAASLQNTAREVCGEMDSDSLQNTARHSEDLSNRAVELWKWCSYRKILVHAEHLPGRENTRAD